MNNGPPFLGTRNKAIILVFLDSGIRLSELANIRLEDVDPHSGIIKVTGKGSKQRLVGIAKTTMVALGYGSVRRVLLHLGLFTVPP